MGWIDEIIEAFNALGGEAKYSQLYHYIENNTHRELTDEWKASVRNRIESHSSDSDNYKYSNPNYFYKIGRGHWGLRSEYIYKPKHNTYSHKTIPTREEILSSYLNNIISNVSVNDLELQSRTLREQYIIDRNRVIVKKLKTHYDNTCQICKIQIELVSGEKYSEVHHLHPLGEDGYDVAQNMIVVCPNCHIELDFGKKINISELTIKEPHFIEEKFLDYQNNKHTFLN